MILINKNIHILKHELDMGRPAIIAPPMNMPIGATGLAQINNGLGIQQQNILNNPRANTINNFFSTININERQESKKVMVRNIAEEIPDLLIESLLKVTIHFEFRKFGISNYGIPNLLFFLEKSCHKFLGALIFHKKYCTLQYLLVSIYNYYRYYILLFLLI